MVKYPNAASGIKKVFLAKIIGVIGVPLAFIPGIGALLLMTCTVAATIFNVWGILEASKDHNGYQTALVFTVADLIFTVVRSGSYFYQRRCHIKRSGFCRRRNGDSCALLYL